jgi:hypothetical protein
MGTLRDRIAYRRATPETAPIMAAVREAYANFGDHMEELLDNLIPWETAEIGEYGEYGRCKSMMLTNLELASRDAIKAVLLATGTPIDDAPAEATYRGGDTR